MKQVLLLLVLGSMACRLGAAVHTEVVEYRQAETVLEGYLAYDDAVSGKRPAVLIVHQWKGLGPYEKKRAEMLAGMGYVAFAVDIYGKGVRPESAQDAAALSGKYKADRALLRARVQAGLDHLRGHSRVDANRIAAIGYCFGGTTVLELARSGAGVAGVVSFHGGLSAPTPATPGAVKAKVLALHGADDPFVPPAEVAGFEDEMRKAGADWQLIAYGGAVHSFTDWGAGTDNSKGAAYNESADRRSWAAMKLFFDEILK